VRVSPQCPLCLTGAEDIKHLLFECQRARQVWDHLGLGQVINIACDIDRAGQAVLEQIISNEIHVMPPEGTASIPELVAVTAWYLWWERCKATRGEALQDPERTARAIEALYSNYFAANSPKAKAKRGGWVKPISDHVKVNVDASFDEDQLRGTTGAVIRDCKGNFVAACNTKLDFVLDALSAEAHALKQGLILAETMGCNRIIMSSDSSEVIKIMQDRGNSSGAAAAIFDDCYHLSSEFSRVLFEHSFRKANAVAHELARIARGSDTQVWIDQAPNFLLPLLRSDVILITDK
jgi:ribonuclease HI